MVIIDYITRYRNGVTALLDSIDILLDLRRQYDALDLEKVIKDSDFSGTHADLTKEQFIAALESMRLFNISFLHGDTEGKFKPGHDTNLYRLKL